MRDEFVFKGAAESEAARRNEHQARAGRSSGHARLDYSVASTGKRFRRFKIVSRGSRR